eukprot:g34149.t1
MTNCQFPDTILQLIRFILNHNIYAFDNQFFIQINGTTTGTRFSPQYANAYMHRFEQDFFAAQNFRPTLYTRYIDDVFFLWTHGEELLKQLDNHINKFQPTIRLTMDYSLESTIVCSKLPSLQDSINHNTIQPCHGNLSKTCQIIVMDTTITCGNTTHHVHGRYSCDSANVIYLICCRQECPYAWEEVLGVLKNIKVDKYPVPDGIYPRILREARKEIAGALRKIFVSSLATGEVPENWRIVNIVPLFKKGGRDIPANYRS